jgi:predicted PurR-regulated permease PerM
VPRAATVGPESGGTWRCALNLLERVRRRLRAAAAASPDAIAGDGSVATHPDEMHLEVVEGEPDEEIAEETHHGRIPHGLVLAADWSWRLLMIAAAIAVLIYVVGKLSFIVVLLAIALLLSALLQPMAAALTKRGVPPALAAAVVLIGGIAAVAGTLTVVVQAFIAGFGDLSNQVQAGLEQVRDWLQTGPLGLTESQINQAIDSGLDDLGKTLNENRQAITAGAVSTAATVGEVLAGIFVVLFATFFFLKDGRRIWTFMLRFVPSVARERMDAAGSSAWVTLISYVRATVLVAFVDAVGIGIGAWGLGVPLALPIGALVFLSSFVPIVGATLSGAVAVLVALVAVGPVKALILLGVVIGVQQLEGHVLQPLLLGRAVALHPLSIMVAITSGALLAGIVGALVAVPLMAVINTAVRVLHRTSHPGAETGAGPQVDTDEPPGTEPAELAPGPDRPSRPLPR